MERRSWILAAAALALVAFGVFTWWNDAERPEEPADRTPESSSGRASHHGSAQGAQVERGSDDGPRDEGAARDPMAQLPRIPVAPAEPAGDPGVARAMPRSAQEAERSSGWRLGATRRRIELLGTRIERVEERVSAFEAEGNADLAERQRSVLNRYQERLTQLRTDEPQLAAEAAADGSAGEESTGYEEAESQGQARGASANVAAPASVSPVP